MTLRISFAAATLLLSVAVSDATAGPYADDLSKCVVNSSTNEDKQGLVQWMFFAIALNPNTEGFAQISPEQRTSADKRMAKLMERLLTDSCLAEAKKAVQYEGDSSVQQAFGLLGQVATTEIFSNPKVSAGAGRFVEHVDTESLGKAIGLRNKGK